MSTKIKTSTYYTIKHEYKIKMSTSGDYMPMLQNNTDNICEKQWLGTMTRLHNMAFTVVNIITAAIKQIDSVTNKEHENYIGSMDTKI